MKKLISLFVLIFSVAIIFAACSGRSYPNLVGVVQNVEFVEEYKHPVYTIATDNNYTVKVVMDDNSYADDLFGGVLTTGDLSAFDKVKIITEYDARKVKRTSDEIIVVRFMWIDEVFYANAKTLSDGTTIGMWDDGFNATYQLEDGTELIRINATSGPDNVYVGNRESFDAFSEQAKPAVLEYYEDRGLLYDADALIEQAYDYYKKDRDNFHTYHVEQSVSPSASNENIMCFLTVVTVPQENGYMGQEIRRGEIFDRNTGELINNFNIFNCSIDKAMDIIFDEAVDSAYFNTADIEDMDKLKSELKAAVKPEYIVLWNENMEISFPAGTLSGYDHCYILGVDYTDNLKSIMHSWTIPNTEW
ncbi:MAG: hypothetical protein IKA10_00900 [Oscillospiraceae bacterium]|nr:hypothetical protein [Oscillospiraceae bacterium]